jgi:hypothetical protein
MGEEKNANAATSYEVDSNWYADSGATDHVTTELDKLTVKDTYTGGDQIYTASESGMHIDNTTNIHPGQRPISCIGSRGWYDLS